MGVLSRAVQEIEMMQTRFIIIASVLLFFAGCVEDKIDAPVNDNTIEYFPLVIGQYIDYAVDSIVFDDVSGGNVKDTVSYQVRELVSGYQISLAGDTIFYLHRSRRNHPEDNWQLTDVWTAGKSSTEATRTEENLKFQKLTFPLRDRKKWSSTSYIPTSTSILVGTELIEAYEDWESEVLDIDIADQVGNFSFGAGQVMHVLQSDVDDGDIRRYVFEKYARHIGLVFRTDTILDSRCIVLGSFDECLGKPWIEHADKGYILSQVMIDHN